MNPTVDPVSSAEAAAPQHRLPGRPWKKGQSGNPSGKPKALREVIALARARGPEAVRRLTELMRTAEPPVAWRCAVALLDRGYGRPVTSLEADLHLTATPPATAISLSWHDQFLARAMMHLPDRVTGWPPLLPERGHELECFREDLAQLDPQAADFGTALEQALAETERREDQKNQTPLWLRCLGDHMVALYPEDWNGHSFFGTERRQLSPRVTATSH